MLLFNGDMTRRNLTMVGSWECNNSMSTTRIWITIENVQILSLKCFEYVNEHNTVQPNKPKKYYIVQKKQASCINRNTNKLWRYIQWTMEVRLVGSCRKEPKECVEASVTDRTAGSRNHLNFGVEFWSPKDSRSEEIIINEIVRDSLQTLGWKEDHDGCLAWMD